MAKSKIYTQDDGSKVAFEFGDDGKLIGIKKKEDGSIFPKSLDPQSKEFEAVSYTHLTLPTTDRV